MNLDDLNTAFDDPHCIVVFRKSCIINGIDGRTLHIVVPPHPSGYIEHKLPKESDLDMDNFQIFSEIL